MRMERYSQRSLKPAERELLTNFELLLERYVANGIITHDELRDINARIYAVTRNHEVTFRQLSLVRTLVWRPARSQQIAIEL